MNCHSFTDGRPAVTDENSWVSHAISNSLPSFPLNNPFRNGIRRHLQTFVRPACSVPLTILNEGTFREDTISALVFFIKYSVPAARERLRGTSVKSAEAKNTGISQYASKVLRRKDMTGLIPFVEERTIYDVPVSL